MREDRPVGQLLREWRHRRNLSQLDLAIQADVSARHVSFVETGRTIPSSAMVLHLAEHLGVPLRERNRLLVAAGHVLPRLAGQAAQSGDPELGALYDELVSYGPAGVRPSIDPADIALPIRIHHGGTELCFINAITTFGAAFDIALEEIAVETYLPADAETTRFYTSS